METALRNGSDAATQMMEAAKALEPQISAAVETMETERRLPPPLVQAMKEE